MIRDRLPKATIITFWHIPWPNPEAFAICPWRAGAARRPARQQHPRLPHAVPLQQLPRHRRPAARGARRPRGLHGHAARPVHAGASLPDLDRVAAGAAGAHRRRRRLPARRARAARPAAPSTGWASASTASTTPRASSSASTPSGACFELEPRWIGKFTLRPDRGADARHDRRLPRLRGAGQGAGRRDQRRATRRRSTRRSSCSPSITSPMPSTSTTAPPTSASSAACTTA